MLRYGIDDLRLFFDGDLRFPEQFAMNVPETGCAASATRRCRDAALADKLTMSGLEVEAYEPVGPGVQRRRGGRGARSRSIRTPTS